MQHTNSPILGFPAAEVCALLTYQALLFDVDAVVEVVVLPAEERRERDDDRGEPDEQNHRAHGAEGARVDVLHLRHRPVSAKEGELQECGCRPYWGTMLLDDVNQWTLALLVITIMISAYRSPQESQYLSARTFLCVFRVSDWQYVQTCHGNLSDNISNRCRPV